MAVCRGAIVRRWELFAIAMAALSTGASADDGLFARLEDEYVITGWSIEDGLPQSSVTSIVQTPDGYLWVGTFGGLVRFDGLRFESMDSSRVPGLPSPAIVALHLDARDRLWIGTDRGTVVGSGAMWDVLDAQDGWRGDYIGSIGEGPDGRVVLCTASGVWLEAAPGSGDGVRLRAMEGAPGPSRFVAVDGGGVAWSASDLYVGHNAGSGWTSAIEPTMLGRTSVGLGAGRDGSMWVLWDGALRRFERGREMGRRELPVHPRAVWDIHEDSRGHVWIATEGEGVWRVAPSGQVARWEIPDARGLTQMRLVQEDAEGNVWLGTIGAGLHRLTPRRVSTLSGPDALAEASSVCPDGDGGLWIGTWGRGVLHMSGSEPGRVRALEGCAPDWHCRCVLQDARGRLWVGVPGAGVWVLENGAFSQVLKQASPLDDPVSMVEDTRGRIWVSTTSAVHVFDDGGSAAALERRRVDLAGVRWLVDRGEGRMWLATIDRVYVADDATTQEAAWGPELVAGGRITCLTIDREGAVWLITDRAMHRRTNGAWVPLPLPGDHASGSIGALSLDERGFYWLSCARGLVRIHRDDLGRLAGSAETPAVVQALGREDGLPSSELASGRQPVQAIDEQGRLWVCTVRGVAMVHTAAFEPRATAPNVVIEGVYRAERTAAEPAALELVDQAGDNGGAVVVRVPAGSQHAQIRFNAVWLAAPERLRFQVRFGGDGASWVDFGSARTASLVGVGPGRHIVDVRARSGDGVWSPRPARLLIDMEPHPWQTAWFRVLCGAGLAGLVAGVMAAVMRARHRREREALELKHKDAELVHLSRVALLGRLTAALSHELNQPLTAILSNAQAAQRFMARQGPHEGEVREILADIVADNGRAVETIRRLRSLFRREERRIEDVDVMSLAAGAVALVRGDAALRHVDLVSDVQESLPLVRGDRVQLQQVLINLMVNAFEALDGHDHDRRVIVRAAREGDGSVLIEVSDSGPGLSEVVAGRVFESFVTTKDTGMGMGLSICRTIIQAHGGHIRVRGHGALGGATFSVTLQPASDQGGRNTAHGT